LISLDAWWKEGKKRERGGGKGGLSALHAAKKVKDCSGSAGCGERGEGEGEDHLLGWFAEGRGKGSENFFFCRKFAEKKGGGRKGRLKIVLFVEEFKKRKRETCPDRAIGREEKKKKGRKAGLMFKLRKKKKDKELNYGKGGRGKASVNSIPATTERGRRGGWRGDREAGRGGESRPYEGVVKRKKEKEKSGLNSSFNRAKRGGEAKGGFSLAVFPKKKGRKKKKRGEKRRGGRARRVPFGGGKKKIWT